MATNKTARVKCDICGKIIYRNEYDKFKLSNSVLIYTVHTRKQCFDEFDGLCKLITADWERLDERNEAELICRLRQDGIERIKHSLISATRTCTNMNKSRKPMEKFFYFECCLCGKYHVECVKYQD